MTTTEQKPANAPDFHAFHVTGREKAYWTRIGAAWKHKDGDGLTLQLELVPVAGGRIVLRKPDAAPVVEDTAAE